MKINLPEILAIHILLSLWLGWEYVIFSMVVVFFIFLKYLPRQINQ